MNIVRRAFNFDNAAILLGVVFGVSGLVGTIVHGGFDDQLLTGLVFLLGGWLYEFTRKEQ
jgi:hypothetical protein